MILFTRIIITFLLFTLVEDGYAGFEHVDKKLLCENLVFVFIPALILSSVNWPLDLLLGMPLFIVAHAIVFARSFAIEGENMSCYKRPETIGSQNSSRWLILKLVLLIAIHSNKKIQITLFLKKE